MSLYFVVIFLDRVEFSFKLVARMKLGRCLSSGSVMVYMSGGSMRRDASG